MNAGSALSWVPWWLMLAVIALLVWLVVSFVCACICGLVKVAYQTVDYRVRYRRVRRRLYRLADSDEGREFAAQAVLSGTRVRHRRRPVESGGAS